MRNYKKLAALALVFVMVLALMPTFAGATATSASTYKDKADIDAKYMDAVELMFEVEIMQGSTSGNFFPKAGLKRSEITKMLYVVANRGNTNANPYIGVTGVPFTDYNNSHWAVGYINWAFIQKIVDGTSPTKFSPDNDVKGYEALKMMLGVAGWKSEIESYTGTNWQMHVLRDAMEANLLDNLMDIDLSKPITREQAAQMLQNLLFSDMVVYSTGLTVTRYTQGGQVGQFYLGLQTLVGVVVANEWVNVGNNGNAGGGEIKLNELNTKLTTAGSSATTVSLGVTAPLDFVGREVKVFVKASTVGDLIDLSKISKVYGKPVLTNKDNVAFVTKGDLALDPLTNIISRTNPSKASADITANYNFYVGYNRENTAAAFTGLRADSPVTLVYGSGDSIKYILAKDYTFGKITVAANGRFGAREFASGTAMTASFNNIEKKDIISGDDLAVKDGLALVGKYGGKWELVAVEAIKGAVTSVFSSGTEALLNGTRYKLSSIKGAEGNFDFAVAASARNKEKTYYIFSGKMLGADSGEAAAPKTYAILTWPAPYSGASNRLVGESTILTGDQGSLNVNFVTVFDTDGSTNISGTAGLAGKLYEYSLNSDKTAVSLTKVAEAAAGTTLSNASKGAARVTIGTATPYLSTTAKTFIYHTVASEWRVYSGRTNPAMQYVAGPPDDDHTAAVIAKIEDTSIGGEATITVAALTSAVAIDTSTGTDIKFLIADDLGNGVDDKGALWHYFGDPRVADWGADGYSYRANKSPTGSAVTDVRAPVGSVITITGVSGKDLANYAINTTKTSAGVINPNPAANTAGIYRGYIRLVSGNFMILSRSTTDAAYDGTLNRDLIVNNDTKVYIVGDDGKAVEDTVKNFYDYETPEILAKADKYNVVVIADADSGNAIVKQLYFIEDDGFWGF